MGWEKECAARSLLKRPHLVGRGTGKGTFFMSKKFGGSQFLSERPAVERHEWGIGTVAQLMNAVCHMLLARAAGADNEHRHGSGRHECCQTV